MSLVDRAHALRQAQQMDAEDEVLRNCVICEGSIPKTRRMRGASKTCGEACRKEQLRRYKREHYRLGQAKAKRLTKE